MATMTITDTGRNLCTSAVQNTNTLYIKYIGIGTGNSTPSSGQTKLDNEVFRKAVTSYTIGSAGQIYINVYIAAGEAVGVAIAEIGIFGGSSAKSNLNSGIMLGRGLYTHTKTNLESIQLQLVLQFS